MESSEKRNKPVGKPMGRNKGANRGKKAQCYTQSLEIENIGNKRNGTEERGRLSFTKAREVRKVTSDSQEGGS